MFYDNHSTMAMINGPVFYPVSALICFNWLKIFRDYNRYVECNIVFIQ